MRQYGGAGLGVYSESHFEWMVGRDWDVVVGFGDFTALNMAGKTFGILLLSSVHVTLRFGRQGALGWLNAAGCDRARRNFLPNAWR